MGNGSRAVLGIAAAFGLASPAPARAAEVVRLHGATTVLDVVVYPNKAEVEKATGLTLELVGNATGKGLVDLAEGRCDASLASEPVEIAVAAAKLAGKDVDPSRLQFAVLRHDEIVFVVHPSNPVDTLTWEQIRDIHTGKITNWREVGGPDKPITVYTDTVTGGTRAMIKAVVMGGAEYGAAVKPLSAVKKVGEMVAADEQGIGGLGKGFVPAGRAKVVRTKQVQRPLGVLTLGTPSPNVGKVIAAFKTALASPR